MGRSVVVEVLPLLAPLRLKSSEVSMTCPPKRQFAFSVSAPRQGSGNSANDDWRHQVMQGGVTFKTLFAGLLNRFGQLLHLPTKVLQLRPNVVRLFADLRGGFIGSLPEPVNSLRDLIDVFREDDQTGQVARESKSACSA